MYARNQRGKLTHANSRTSGKSRRQRKNTPSLDGQKKTKDLFGLLQKETITYIQMGRAREEAGKAGGGVAQFHFSSTIARKEMAVASCSCSNEKLARGRDGWVRLRKERLMVSGTGG